LHSSTVQPCSSCNGRFIERQCTRCRTRQACIVEIGAVSDQLTTQTNPAHLRCHTLSAAAAAAADATAAAAPAADHQSKRPTRSTTLAFRTYEHLCHLLTDRTPVVLVSCQRHSHFDSYTSGASPVFEPIIGSLGNRCATHRSRSCPIQRCQCWHAAAAATPSCLHAPVTRCAILTMRA
jgi:hypothetical protein